ncbi:MAG: sensor histidine kinase [Clostridia bacterium]|nr:sensor histidine kinase [Clostridia bacterium]
MKLKRISTKFILSFVSILTAVFSVLIAVFYIGFRVSMNNYIRRNSFSMQEELDLAVMEVLNESAYLYGRIMGSANVDLLTGIADGERDKSAREADFDALIARVGFDEEYFNDIVIITGETRFGLDKSFINPPEEYIDLLENKNNLAYIGNVDKSLVMGIYSSGSVSGFEGFVLFYMSENKISEMCNPVSGSEGYSFIMRSDGYIISHIDTNLVGKVVVYSDVYNPEAAPEYKTETLDGSKRIIVTSKPELLNSRYAFHSCIVSVLDYKYYFGRMDTTLIIVLCVSFAMLVVSVVLAIIRARKISKPITLLSDSINATAEPTKNHISVLREGDELVQLEKNYDDMMDRIFDLVERNKEDMQLQRKLELESLQMQINPHFLYNTLDAISWMARIKKQPEIDRLVMNLAKFFRLFLHGGDKFVKVSEEVEMVQSYLEIDAIRYPGRVTVHTEIAEEVKDRQTLKLILQPIVENCLKYAFVTRNGNMYIRAYGEGEDIIFEVEDDGDGFEVPEDILNRPATREGGYGLKNVNERIRLQYGEGYGLEVTSEKGKGTKVKARLK